MLIARSKTEIESAGDAIRQAGGAAATAVLDVTNVQETSAWIADQQCFDILVNNAGANRPAEFVEDAPRVITTPSFPSMFVRHSLRRRRLSVA